MAGVAVGLLLVWSMAVGLRRRGGWVAGSADLGCGGAGCGTGDRGGGEGWFGEGRVSTSVNESGWKGYAPGDVTIIVRSDEQERRFGSLGYSRLGNGMGWMGRMGWSSSLGFYMLDNADTDHV